jgi:hypothetical protein
MRFFLLICLVAAGCSPSRNTDCPGPAATQLFVADDSGQILVFDASAEGNAVPLRTVGIPIFDGPLAVDTTSHELFAVRQHGIEVYPSIAGETTPLRILSGPPGPESINGLAVDPTARVLFALTFSGVFMFPEDGEGEVGSLGAVGGETDAVAFDPLHREVVIGTTKEIDVYPADLHGFPIRTHEAAPDGSNGGLLTADALAVDTRPDALYAVTEEFQHHEAMSLVVFDGASYGTAAPLNTISMATNGPIVVDCARGELFAATVDASGQPGVSVFRADGSLTLIRQLQLQSFPLGLALGP